MIPLVVDTSVAFKWARQAMEEEYIEQAIAILERHLQGEVEIHIPSLLYYELGNLLRLKGNLVTVAKEEILGNFFAIDLVVYEMDAHLALDTLSLADRHKITFYDAVFVALAQAIGCEFVTADKGLFKKIKTLSHTRFLGDFHSLKAS